ncbi:Protein TusB [Serratia symbiotica]|nr:Protein TusB [Serratia symbiotica]
MLCTLSRSPTKFELFALLRFVTKDDVILLLQDGVLSGLINNIHYKLLLNTSISIYALEEDIKARGLMNFVSHKIIIIKYSNFVELTEKHYNQIAW